MSYYRMKVTKLVNETRGGSGHGLCEVDGETFYFTCDGFARGSYILKRYTEEELELLMGERSDDLSFEDQIVGVLDMPVREPEYVFRHEDIDWSEVGDPVRYIGEGVDQIKWKGEFYPYPTKKPEPIVRYHVVITEDYGPYKEGDIIWESPYNPDGFGREYPTRVEVLTYGVEKREVYPRERGA